MSGDSWINESLRNVAVPDSLSARLQEIGTLSDGDLDAALRHATPRAQLRDRLLAIGTRSDADLDDELRLVEVSAEWLERCRWIPLEPVERGIPLLNRAPLLHTRPFLQYALAAGLMLMITGISWRFLRPDPVANPLPRTEFAQDDMFIEPADLDALFPQRPNVDLPTPPEAYVRNSNIPYPTSPDRPTLPTDSTLTKSNNPVVSNAVVERRDATSEGENPQVVRNRVDAENVFGTAPNGDLLPDLMSVREPEARGIRPPSFREYDLIFQLRHGVHPFVSPSARAELATVQVPLTTSTATFDDALRRAVAGRTPSTSQLRVEDFLAAMDYEFPRPNKPTLGLRTAAGISPWSEQGLGLIQLGVQAGEQKRDPKSAQRLTFLVDGSAAMGRHWENLVDGLTRIADQLLPDDRITIVLFGATTETRLVDGTPKQFRAALSKLSAYRPEGVGNVVAALRTILAELETPATNDDAKLAELPRRIALLTAGASRSEPDFDRLTTLAERVLPSRAVLDVYDLRGDDTLDSQLSTIASWSRDESHNGTPHPAGGGRELAWKLRENLDGQSTVIAHDVTLRVTFVPEAVALYRLMGHEATAVAGLIPLEWRADLRSGEAASALFEVAIRPDGPETIAHAVLEWRDPAGKTHTMKQPISRLQFAPSFAEAPWSLQLAALAAETAEVLRGSYFAPVGSHDLGEISATAARLPERRQDKMSLRRLRQFWPSDRIPARDRTGSIDRS